VLEDVQRLEVHGVDALEQRAPQLVLLAHKHTNNNSSPATIERPWGKARAQPMERPLCESADATHQVLAPPVAVLHLLLRFVQLRLELPVASTTKIGGEVR
jgi:hypothetical protein